MRLHARIIAAVLALAVAPAFAQSGDATTKRAANSGFLVDYSKLKAAPDREGVLLYIDRSAKYRDFTKIMFRPVEVYVAPGTSYKGIQPDALKRMTDELR